MLLPFIQPTAIKKAFTFACLLFAVKFLAAQNVGIGTTTPNANALLDITSTNKGILIPRLTYAQMLAITGPEGLLVYNTDAGAFAYRNASSWVYLKGNIGTVDNWHTNGNSDVTSNDFFGTTSNFDLIFKRNNQRAGLIGVNNTSWGSQALNPVTTGYANTAIGYQSLYSNTTGANNTANGTFALYSNTTGNNNTSNGEQTLNFNQTGSNNTANGFIALSYNVSGNNNTADGVQSLLNNDSGNNNTALGFGALQSNGSGSSNVAIGIHALNSNTNKSNLVAIGDSALHENGYAATGATEAIQNTGVGSKVLYNNRAGSGNTAFGFQSLNNNTDGNNNTGIGMRSDVISNTLTNATVIGANALVGCSNCMVLGDSINNVKVGIGTAYPTSAKLVIKTAPGLNGIDLSSSDAYADMRVIRNTMGQTDHDLYFNFGVFGPNSLHMYSNGGETMTVKNGNVGIGSTNPAPTAALEISSTTKGFLPSRMTHAQRDAIASPATGLIIWCTDVGLHGQIEVYNGIEWTNMTGGVRDPYIGEPLQGGVVAYIFQPGDPGYVQGQAHGLIAAPTDLGTAEWGCRGTSIAGTSALVGTGNANTELIVPGCPTSGIAARLCRNLVLNGYSDWYLPSENDLKKIAINQAIVGGFSATNYWSSTQNDLNFASTIDFNTNAQIGADKSLSFAVRAVRSF